MANVTSTSNVPSGVEVYYDKLLLARAEYELIYSKYGQERNLPSENSDSIKFRRYANLATATTALTEGVTPQGSSLSVTDIVAKVSQYGDYITITDVVQFVVEDNVLNEGANILAQQMGETIDELARDVLASTASVFNCVNGTNLGTPTELNETDIKKVTGSLMTNKSKMFTPMIEGSDKFGTTPVQAAFWVLAHTDLISDLEAMDNFRPTAQYGKQMDVQPSEWGSFSNTRWVLSPNATVDAGVYGSIVLGKNAYGTTKLSEGISGMIFKQPTDPLDQRSTQGWKSMYVATLLNENWMTKINSTLGA
jgi:N4-gp56 family major capsid protein